jgi:hypothetical protein
MTMKADDLNLPAAPLHWLNGLPKGKRVVFAGIHCPLPGAYAAVAC